MSSVWYTFSMKKITKRIAPINGPNLDKVKINYDSSIDFYFIHFLYL